MPQLAIPESLTTQQSVAEVVTTFDDRPKHAKTSATVAPPRLETEVLQCLRSSGYRCLANVLCRCHHGHVTLIGRVPTYHMKQLAQECARRADGVEKVDNRLIVSHVG